MERRTGMHVALLQGHIWHFAIIIMTKKTHKEASDAILATATVIDLHDKRVSVCKLIYSRPSSPLYVQAKPMRDSDEYNIIIFMCTVFF